jgi:glycosyltransferase involved in cell wall biosynthesis
VKRLLVIAYYTPPLGMSGVMRVTKLVKFLPRHNWHPIVLTVRPIAYYHRDPDLLADWPGIPVHRAESLDPARLRHLLLPSRPLRASTTGRPGWLSNVLCFPDAKAGWYLFACRMGEKLLRRERPAAIFATAPPFTSLMIGRHLKRHSGLPLVSDFRDPWPMGLIPPPWFQKPRIERLRRSVLDMSDAVLAVNQGTAAHLEGRAEVLENGFDPDEFAVPARRFAGFNIVQVGNLWENEAGLAATLTAIRHRPHARIRFVGKADARSLRRFGEDPHFEYLGPLPHADALAAMKGADLLLYLGKPHQPAGIKLYEYLGSGRPVLSVGSECAESDRLIEQHHCGISVGPDPTEISAAIELLRSAGTPFAPVGVERYDRSVQAGRLARILDRLVGGNATGAGPDRPAWPLLKSG